MQIELWPTDKPIPYARNARKLSDAAVDTVAASIREFGWQQPIVVDTEGTVIAGHTRLLAAKKLALATVPVYIADKLTPGQVKAYRLMDNRSHEESSWDYELLGAEMFDLRDLEMDLSLTGFSEAELANLLASENAGLTDPDAVPPTPAEAVSKPGDLWLLGAHRLVCGDSIDPAVVAHSLGDLKPLLLVTDPPYGIELDSEWRDRAGINGDVPGSIRRRVPRKSSAPHAAEPSYMKHRTEGHTETTISGDTRADWSEVFEQVPSVQVAYVWHASVYTREVLDGLERIGFLYPQQIIWDKGRVVLTRTHYWFQHEPCWYVRKKRAPWYGKPGSENSSIWQAASPKFMMGSSEEKFDHPTQKPAELMAKPMRNHTLPGEAVFEPFCGSGTTLIAAEQTNRICCAIELEPKYVDVIVTRWQNFTGKDAVLDGDGRTFAVIKEERIAVAA